jgi:hypothetical protein
MQQAFYNFPANLLFLFQLSSVIKQQSLSIEESEPPHDNTCRIIEIQAPFSVHFTLPVTHYTAGETENDVARCRNLPGCSEENHGTYWSGQPVSRPKYEQDYLYHTILLT